MRSTPLAGRFFSDKCRVVRRAGDAIVEDFSEPSADPLRAGPQTEPVASASPSAAPRDLAGETGIVRKSDHRSRKHVVLFAPGPITEADLHKANRKFAATLKQRRRRAKRLRWLADNAATIVFVTGLLVLVWLVAAK